MEARAADGTPIWFEVTGDGPPVVMIHGLADDHRLWRHLVPTLAQEFRVVTVDVRGHGQSGKPPGPYSVSLFGEDVLSVCDSLGIDETTLVGLSMGGGISQTIALEHPERVHALGLVSTSSSFSEETRARFMARADHADRTGSIAELVEGMVARWFTPAFAAAHPEIIAETEATVGRNEPHALAASCRANGVRSWTDRLHEIKVPVLYVAGLDDPSGVRAHEATYRAHLPDVETHLVEDASHLLPIEKPDELIGYLLPFLRRVHAA